MHKAKDIAVRPISQKDAVRIVKSQHYSGTFCRSSKLHLGVFLNGKCGGAMQFGSPLKREYVLPLVAGTKWNDMIELNRMAFADWLPRNSESRALGWAMRYIRKQYPNIEWVLSFADGTQCGDGTIYRASGFVLTAIRKNTGLASFPDGRVVQMMTLHSNPTKPRPEASGKSYFQITGGKYNFARYVKEVGGKILSGHQLRYIYFLNPSARKRLTVPEIPFAEIRRRGAGMYKGKSCVRSVDSDTPAVQVGEGGATPTRTLQKQKASRE